MKIDLISFDLDHTLIDFARTLDLTLATVAEFLSAETGTLFTVPMLHKSREAFAARPVAQGMALLDIRQAGIAELLGTSHTHLAEAAMALFKEQRFDHMQLMPGALDMLTTLSAEFPLAILSNGNSYPDRIGIDHFFRHIFLEDNIPHLKPDPRAFDALANLAGIAPAQIVHIGDSFEDDVIGARAAGAVPLWYNPDGAPSPDTDVLELRHFSELPSALRALQEST